MNKIALILPLLALTTNWNGIHSLEVEYNPIVQSILSKEAFLKCNVLTDLAIKQVTWFKIGRDGSETVYYYEPAIPLDRRESGYERFSRSQIDNTSLNISEVQLADQGNYRCRVLVWDPPAPQGAISTNNVVSSIPTEETVSMRLVVNVPPREVQLSTSTVGNNVTLRCRASGAKPSAQISWLKTMSDGSTIPLHGMPKEVVVEHRGDLSDTTELLHYGLSVNQRTVRISCVVNHTETNTVTIKNITMVSPRIQNAVTKYLERIGANISYSKLEDQHDDPDNPASLVKISAKPGFQVDLNSSVTLTASAPGVTPQPHYLWWTGEQAAYAGKELYIPSLEEDKTYFVLAENALGRVLLSVSLSVVGDSDTADQDSQTQIADHEQQPVNSAGMSGGIIAVIVIACAIAGLLIGLIIWYCICKNSPDEGFSNVNKNKIVKKSEESDLFVPSEKPLMRTTSTQTLEGRRSKKEQTPKAAASEGNLLSGTATRPTVPPPKRPTQAQPPGRGYGSQGSSSAREDTQSELSIPGSEDVV